MIALSPRLICTKEGNNAQADSDGAGHTAVVVVVVAAATAIYHFQIGKPCWHGGILFVNVNVWL
jgi:hypothetical protein